MSSDHGESDVTPTESKTTRTVGNFPRGSREIPETSVSSEKDRSEKARCHTSDMHVSGKSDSLVVPEKRVNKAGLPTAAESVEERRLTEENTKQSSLARTQCRPAEVYGLFGVRAASHQVQEPLNLTRQISLSSKVRAVCGSSARTDLCGGRAAMPVPTAIVVFMNDSRSR
jgi:hypothetical protein